MSDWIDAKENPPIMGVGGCGVSCEKLGRKFIGCELDEKYYEIARQRICQ